MEKKPIKDIREQFEAAGEERSSLYMLYGQDERSGVQKLIEKYRKKDEWLVKEHARLEEMMVYEKKYQEYGAVCGIDEVGRGPLAGPVVAGAVILHPESRIMYLNDSKQLTAARREELYDIIMEEAIAVGTGIVWQDAIDEMNILQATYEAMRQAVKALGVKPDVFLNDAVMIPDLEGIQVPIVKGDAKSLSIAAASVIAKVTRDRMMEEYDLVYPGYGFASNKGYGSAEHISAIKSLGPTPLHRKSFIGSFVE